MENKKIMYGIAGAIAISMVAFFIYNLTSSERPVFSRTNVENNASATGDLNSFEKDVMPPSKIANTNLENNTQITFDNMVHDFGVVPPESVNSYQFTFTNTGSEPLIIENAKGSCGCTVPNAPKEPILPGKTGVIDVEFKPKKSQTGNQTKTVTVTANTDPVETILTIRADVKP